MARSNPNGPEPNEKFNSSNNASIWDTFKSSLDSGSKEIEELKLALQKREDVIQTLSNQVSKLKKQLADAEKRGSAEVESKLSQFGQLVRASVDITLGGDEPISEGEMLREMLGRRVSQLSGIGSSTRSTINLERDCNGNEGEMLNNDQVGVHDDDNIRSGNRETGSHLPVTWSSISPDCREIVKETLQQHYLNHEKIADKLEGPILVELMNGRMPLEKDLFESIVESQFAKYEAASGEAGLTSVEMGTIHLKLALSNIFPWHSQDVASTSNLNSSWKEHVFKLGIVEVKNSEGDMQFIEDGFVNFFVARWVAEMLTIEGGWNKQLSTLLIKDGLEINVAECPDPDCQEDDDANNSEAEWKNPKCHTFLKDGFCSLLNSFVGEQKEDIRGHRIDFTEVCEQADITAIGLACIHNEFSHIFKLFLKLGTFNGSGIADLLFANSVIAVAIRKANLEFFKIAKSSFKNDCWMNVDLKVQALEEAVQRGDLPMAEFFLDEMGMSEMVKESNVKLANMIPLFTENSRDNSDELIEKKVKVLQFLNSVNPILKIERSRRREGQCSEREGPPLLGYGVHARLLTELLELGADVHAVDSDNDTVLHLNAEPNEVFESLFNIIPDGDLKKMVHIKGYLGDTPLMRVVRWAAPTRQILEKLLTAGADINVVDSEGYSVIAVAIREGKDASLVNLLMDMGASLAWRGRNQETLLHVAAGYVRPQLVSEFLKNKMDPNCEDADGRIPLDYLLEFEFENIKDSNSKDKSLVMETGITLRNAGGKCNESVDDEGQTLLHHKAKVGQCWQLELLIELGLNVNEVDNLGNTPLHLVMGNHFPQNIKVEYLLLTNANPNAVNANGDTALHIGLKNWDALSLNTLQLLKSRTEFQWTESYVIMALEYIICQCKNYPLVKLRNLLVSLELDRKEYFQYKNMNGDTLLHIATICGNEGAVKLLLLEGLDINVKNELLQTSLHVTAYLDNKNKAIRMAKCLIEEGADASIKDREDYTFLHRFVMAGDIRMDQFQRLFEYLLWRDKLRLFNIPGGPYSSTPLQEAVKLLDIQVKTINSLTSRGVNIKVVDKFGDSVLSYAVRGQKDENFLTNLKGMGLDWNHVNFKEQNLLHIASQAGNCIAVELLLENGVDVNWVDNEGNNPLHWLMQVGKKNILKMARSLILNGGNVASRNKEGLTPLEICSKRRDGVMAMTEELRLAFEA